MFAQNEKAKTPDLFILHARKPAFIARVVGDKKLELVEVYQLANEDQINKIMAQMNDWLIKTQIDT